MSFLDYRLQVSELEKIAKLSPSPARSRELPALRAPDRLSTCLVCSARPARGCSRCESVSYCTDTHQRDDARWHDPVCETLRDIAEDARGDDVEALADLLARAARHADVRALAGWDDYLGTDLAPARRRGLTDLATRALTLASAASELPQASALRIHVMAAAQRELDVPAAVWALAERLLGGPLDILLVGPDLPADTQRVHRGLYRRALWRDFGQPDLVIGYDCGILMYPTWKSTILELRGSGVPFVITTLRSWEATAEARLLTAVGATCVRPPAPNPWATLAGRRSTTIANDLSFDNAYVSVWR